MKKLLPIVALAFAVIAGGCSQSTQTTPDDGAPITPELTPEQTAERMLKALTTGDVDTFLYYVDLRGIYETRFPEQMRKRFTYEQMEAAIKAARTRAYNQKAGKLKKLSYEIVGVEDRNGFKVVTIKTQSRPGRPWRTQEAFFGRFDGMWKLTGKGLTRLKTE